MKIVKAKPLKEEAMTFYLAALVVEFYPSTIQFNHLAQLSPL